MKTDKTKQNTASWEIRFEKLFCHHDGGLELDHDLTPGPLKQFIKQEIATAKAEQLEEINKNILMPDFPTAWAVMRETDPEQHHERCSFRQSKGGILCDCAAEKALIAVCELIKKYLNPKVTMPEEDL